MDHMWWKSHSGPCLHLHHIINIPPGCLHPVEYRQGGKGKYQKITGKTQEIMKATVSGFLVNPFHDFILFPLAPFLSPLTYVSTGLIMENHSWMKFLSSMGRRSERNPKSLWKTDGFPQKLWIPTHEIIIIQVSYNLVSTTIRWYMQYPM